MILAVVSNPEQYIKQFDVNIDNNGEVTINGKVDTISYNMKEFTKEEALKDFVKTRLSRFIGLNVHQILAIS